MIELANLILITLQSAGVLTESTLVPTLLFFPHMIAGLAVGFFCGVMVMIFHYKLKEQKEQKHGRETE